MTMDQLPPLELQSVYELQTMMGREIARSDWISLTQDRIQAFAEVTGDRQWIHLDSARAQQESPYGSTIAHGFLTLSLLSEMFRSVVQIRDAGITINYGLNRVRFPAAVPAGSRIRAAFSVQAFKTVVSGVEVTFSVVVECENAAKPCCVAEWILRYSA
jgi:acyl dehydratase